MSNKRSFHSVIRRLSSISYKSPLFIHSYPGSRVFELASPSSGNKLSINLISGIKAKLSNISDNFTVSAVFFSSFSKNGNVFSTGIDLTDFLNDREKYLESINNLSSVVSLLKKETFSVYSGHSNGTGFGVFSGAKYRLGTLSTSLCIDELFHGFIPCGGLASHIVSNSGVEFARFLATSKILLKADDMYALGLVTHIVEEDPHDTIADAIAHTVPESLISKRVQMDSVDASCIPDILDTMHVGCDLDVMSGEVWDRLMLVKPAEELSMSDTAADQSQLIPLIQIIQECYSTDDYQETIRRLQSHAPQSEILAQALQAIQTIDPKTLQSWYDITRLATTQSVEAVYAAEIRANVGMQ